MRYGAFGSYAYREIYRSGLCSIAGFGVDPAAGYSKTCEMEIVDLQAGAPVVLESSDWLGHKVRHSNFIGYISAIGSGNSPGEWADSRWMVRAGLADSSCFSFEADGMRGYFLRHKGAAVRIDAPDGTSQFNGDATFCVRTPLNGNSTGGASAISLESKNAPGQYLRHVDGNMGVAPNDGTLQFGNNAAFLTANPYNVMTAGSVVNIEPSTWPGYRVRHANFLGLISPINAWSATSDQGTSAWLLRPGLANAGCVSFESADRPGLFLRPLSQRIRLDPRDGSGLFDRDATFCLRGALNGRLGGAALSMESLSYPGNFMVHRNFELWIAPTDGTDLFKSDATFVPATQTLAPVPQNIALTAALATSYVSPWETLAAIINNVTPANSVDKTTGAYGNWRGADAYGATDWVSFTWPTLKTLSAFEVYWWNDGEFSLTPTTAKVEYWNGTAWVSLGSPGLAVNTFNRLNFGPVSATAIRVSMSSTRATAILEARVLGF